MVEQFVQCCDSRYGPQGLAMLRSLQSAFKRDLCMTWVACDMELYSALVKLDDPEINVIYMTDVESSVGGFSERSKTEWFWTMASQSAYFALERNQQRTTYLDSDMYFWRSPQSLFDEFGDSDASMYDHNFPDVDGKPNPAYSRAKYLVAWNTFAYSDAGRECCRWWAERVREKCEVNMPGYPELGIPPGFAGDQAWLNAFDKFCKVCVHSNPAGQLAPYNISRWSVNDYGFGPIINATDARSRPVICYHFHEWKGILENGVMQKRTGYPLPDGVIKLIYEPYERAVESAAKELWA